MATAALSKTSFEQTRPAPIDLVRLATNTLGNRELEVQVLRMFVTQSRAMLERLGKEGKASAQYALVHTLKGSALGVGADAVADCCVDVEAELHRGQPLGLSDLRHMVEETNSFIFDLLDG